MCMDLPSECLANHPLQIIPTFFFFYCMQEKKALSSRGRGRLRGFLELRRPWGFSPEARRGSQGASRAAPGKSGLHARGEGERVLALESREGTRASRRVEEGLSRSLSGGGGKPSFPSPSAGDLRELPRVPLRGERLKFQRKRSAYGLNLES